MKKILTLIGLVALTNVNGQTVDSIDNLRINILSNLRQYECLKYEFEEPINDDAVRYDTAYFYCDNQGDLIYISWQARSHYFHITGDVINISELIFQNNKAVLRINYGYSFDDPQWHREPDLNETKIHIFESTREYYKEDGSALVEYKGREILGTYSDRFSLLNSIPLEQKLERRWSNRCDECIEKEFLNVFRMLLEERNQR